MRKDTFDLGQSTKVKPGDDMVISDLWGPLFSTKNGRNGEMKHMGLVDPILGLVDPILIYWDLFS